MRKLIKKNSIISYLFALSFAALYLNIILSDVMPGRINHAVINYISCILPSIIFLIIIKKIRIQKTNVILILALSILQIITFIKNTNYDTNSDSALEIATISSFIINIFCVSVFLNSEVKSKKSFNIVLKTIIFFTLIFCIYNMVINFPNITKLFDPRLASNISFASFYNNRNNFAKLLFLSIIILYYAKNSLIIRNKTYYLLIIIIMLNMLATLSRTGIVTSMLFIIITQMTGTMKQKIKLFVLMTLATISIIALGGMLFVNNSIVRSDAGDSGRTNIWQKSLRLFAEEPIFGYGENHASKLLKQEAGNMYFHNVIIKNLVTQGIIFTLLFAIYIIYNCKNNILNKQNINRRIVIASYISILIYCTFESFDLFTFGLFNLLVTMIVFVLPVLYSDNNQQLIKKESSNEK